MPHIFWKHADDGNMIYLASPYTHPDARVREQRFREACRATAGLMRAGHVVFSPVVHSHPLVEHGLPTEWDYWERIDREHLQRFDEVLVLTLDGWRESIGVAAEIRIAREFGKPVGYLAADGRTVSPQVAHVAKETGR